MTKILDEATATPITAQEILDLYKDVDSDFDCEYRLEGDSLVQDLPFGKVTFSPGDNFTWIAKLESDEFTFPSIIITDIVGKAVKRAEKYVKHFDIFPDGEKKREEHTITRDAVIRALDAELGMFTFHAETHSKHKELTDRIPTLVLFRAGGACPFQAEGTLDGLPFYFRYRGGSASLRVAHDEDGIFDTPLYSSSLEYGDNYNGSLNEEEFIAIFTHLVSHLDKSSIRWEFVSTKEDATKLDSSLAWGNTAQEAWNDLNIVTPGISISQEQWTEYLQERQLNPISPTVDNRVFPDSIDFTVLPSADPYARSIAELKAVVLAEAKRYEEERAREEQSKTTKDN